jgi:hypothetical protein
LPSGELKFNQNFKDGGGSVPHRASYLQSLGLKFDEPNFKLGKFRLCPAQNLKFCTPFKFRLKF